MKIAILTTFTQFYPGYSLTGIVKDKAEMLTKYGHEVHLFVNERYKGETFPGDVILEKKIPFAHLKSYGSITEVTPEHKMVRNKTKVMLESECQDFDIIMTEDFIFQGWNLPYALGIMEAAPNLDKPRWLHWVHSIPTGRRDWWDIRFYNKKHKIVYPNKTDRQRVAEEFRGTADDIVVIPHIKDIRSWMDFEEDAKKIIDWAPGLMNADIVKVYPCSVDRLPAKGISDVISIMAHIKRSMKSVCLFLATQWATGPKQWSILEEYKKEATEKGLVVGEDIVFSADYNRGPGGRPQFGVAVPKKILRNLMQLSNLFIFPTTEETFGLVYPEIVLSSGALTVLNKSLGMMAEVSGFNGISFEFGSYHHKLQYSPGRREPYMAAIAQTILGHMLRSESIRSRTFIRQSYNYDHLYSKYYGPMFGVSKSWI